MGNAISNWWRSPDMSQIVVSIESFERDLRIPAAGGLIGKFGMKHRGLVARTRFGQLYLIEKGVSTDEDLKFRRRYRSGSCRIVLITEQELQGWSRMGSPTKVSAYLTLQRLFNACGGDYSLLSDNCWHGVDKMLETARTRPSFFDGLNWILLAFLLMATLSFSFGQLFLLILSLLPAQWLRGFALPSWKELTVLAMSLGVNWYLHASFPPEYHVP